MKKDILNISKDYDFKSLPSDYPLTNSVKVDNDNILVPLIDICDFSGNDIRYTKQLIQNYRDDFDIIGLNVDSVSFKGLKTLMLTELQTNFLLMLMRNSKEVVKFKLALSVYIDKIKKDNQQLKIDFSESQIQEFQYKIDSKDNQLKEKDKIIQKVKRKAYANSGDDKFCNVHKFINDHNLNISANELNNILIDENILGQKLINKYAPCPTGEYSKYEDSSIVVNISKMLEICTKRNIKEFEKVDSLFDVEG